MHTSSLTFSSALYSVDQVVTVTAVDDLVDHNPDQAVSVTVNGQSSNTLYNELVQLNVGVTLTDNDVAALNISPVDFTIDEGDATGLVVMTLDTKPTSTVTVSLASADGALVSVTGSPVEFSTGNYGSARTVTLSAVEDVIDYATIVTTVSVTVDANDGQYDGLVHRRRCERQ